MIKSPITTLTFVFAFIITTTLRCVAGGEEVVVIYNTKVPDSKTLAYYYARLRDVPPEQVLGFALPDSETISRKVFRDDLQRPLAKKLESLKLWRIGRGDLPGTNNTRVAVARKVTESKIRYAVLCYGMPLRISRDANLREAEEDKTRPEMRRNEAAVDSELACLPLLPNGYSLTGPHLNLLYGTTNATDLHPTNGLLIVTRLDGPTMPIARSLVDKALQAETNGLWGRAYFDVRNIADPGYKIGDDWIKHAATLTKQFGFDTVIDEGGDTFPAGFPMSQIGIYIGWYREHVSGPFTLPNVEFMPGAFAYHLHSFSALTLRTTDTRWTAPLLAKGATCSMGSVDEPYLTGTPDVGAFIARWLYLGFTFGEAAYAGQQTVSWQTTVVGDPLYRPFGRNLQEQHLQFLTETNQLAEWSLQRVINLSRLNGASIADLATALEETVITKTSAVLTEKLAELYDAQGKPASTIAAYERALTLNPTPQQRLRLRLVLGEKLVAAQRFDQARENYQKLLAENPNYADEAAIQQKLASLETE